MRVQSAENGDVKILCYNKFNNKAAYKREVARNLLNILKLNAGSGTTFSEFIKVNILLFIQSYKAVFNIINKCYSRDQRKSLSILQGRRMLFSYFLDVLSTVLRVDCHSMLYVFYVFQCKGRYECSVVVHNHNDLPYMVHIQP